MKILFLVEPSTITNGEDASDESSLLFDNLNPQVSSMGTHQLLNYRELLF